MSDSRSLYLYLYLTSEVQIAKQELSLADCTLWGTDFLTERGTNSHYQRNVIIVEAETFWLFFLIDYILLISALDVPLVWLGSS